MAIRINDLARELGVKSRHILNALPDLGVDTKKNHSSSLDASAAEKVRERFRTEPNYHTTAVAQDTRQFLIGKGIIKPAPTKPNCYTTAVAQRARQFLIGEGVIKPAQVLPVDTVESVSIRSELPFNKKNGVSEAPKKHKKSFCTICRREISANKLLHHVKQKHNGHTRCVICGRQVELRCLAGHTKNHNTKRFPTSSVVRRAMLFTGTPEPLEKPDTRIPCQQCGAKVFPHAMQLHITNNHSEEKTEQLPDVRSTQFPFVVLPAGHWDFREVFDYYRRNSGSHPHKFFEQVFDWNRIEQLAKLKPNLRHFGVKAWFGYAVYEFSYSHRVVLECPIEGNATYIISGDWKNMIHKTKAELRSRYASQCTRVVHVGDWLNRVFEGLRASGGRPGEGS